MCPQSFACRVKFSLEADILVRRRVHTSGRAPQYTVVQPPCKHWHVSADETRPDGGWHSTSQHEDVVQPQLLPPPFAGQPAIVLKHAHFSWGDGDDEHGCTLQDISLKVCTR